MIVTVSGTQEPPKETVSPYVFVIAREHWQYYVYPAPLSADPMLRKRHPLTTGRVYTESKSSGEDHSWQKKSSLITATNTKLRAAALGAD